MGRPGVDRGRRSVVSLAVRLSARQRDLIARAAAEQGLGGISAFVRDAALIAAAEVLGLEPTSVLGATPPTPDR